MRWTSPLVAVSLALATLPALAADAPASLPRQPVDLSPVRDKLEVLSDGQGHYFVLVPFGPTNEHLYYGDGKTFAGQRVTGGSKSGTESFDRVFWEPRVASRWKAALDHKDGRYHVRCDDKVTELFTVMDDEKQKVLTTGQFTTHTWDRQPYALARDEKGTFFYVDQVVGDKAQFRVFRGPRGAMKQVPVTSAVIDPAGDVFTTKDGALRVVAEKKESAWAKGKSRTPLTVLEVEENLQVIYKELGVYQGQKLGTPCDDLM